MQRPRKSRDNFFFLLRCGLTSPSAPAFKRRGRFSGCASPCLLSWRVWARGQPLGASSLDKTAVKCVVVPCRASPGDASSGEKTHCAFASQSNRGYGRSPKESSEKGLRRARTRDLTLRWPRQNPCATEMFSFFFFLSFQTSFILTCYALYYATKIMYV